MMYELASFYNLPTLPHRCGFAFNDIFRWDYDTLEVKHDYIQWYFPLGEVSKFSASSPVLCAAQLEYFSRDRRAQEMQRKVLNKMYEFFGMNRSFFSLNWMLQFRENDPHWIQPSPDIFDHNYLRISRIIASLKLFRNDREAKLLVNLLMKKDTSRDIGVFPEKTIQFWVDALETDPEEVIDQLNKSS